MFSILNKKRKRKDCSIVGVDSSDNAERESIRTDEVDMFLNLGYRKLETMFLPKQPEL